LETREARLERVSVPPAQGAEDAPLFAARCLAWVLEGELELETGSGAALETQLEGRWGRLEPSLPAGVIHSSSDAPSRFRNPGPETACLFRCWKRTL
jgi:hypothetical protein